jgi:cation transport ATPase
MDRITHGLAGALAAQTGFDQLPRPTATIAVVAGTMCDMRQNLFFAFIHNALGIPVAACVPYRVSGLLPSPIIAGAAMSFTSVSVIANALRLRKLMP